MRPMSLYESGESSGEVSLEILFNNDKISGTNKLTLDDIAYLCCRGGWPRTLFLDKDIALDGAYNYCESIINTDMSKVDGITRSPERVRNLMKSYSRNIGTSASNETIREDMIKNDSLSLDTDTVVSYVNALKKLFVVEDTSAWNPNLKK